MSIVRRLTPRDRRALVVGTVLLVPALTFRLALLPYGRALAATRDDLARERSLLERERALLADAVRVPDRLEDVGARLEVEAPRLFGATDEVAATAALSRYVADRARSHRVLLQQGETGTPLPAGGGVIGLTVTLRGLGDLEGILGFLHALEEGPKLVRVERLAIEQVERLGSRSKEDEEVLTVSALVRGYAVLSRPPAAEPLAMIGARGNR